MKSIDTNNDLLTVMMRKKFDAREEMEEAARMLEMGITLPIMSNRNIGRGEEARVTLEHYERVKAQVQFVKAMYVKKLQDAREKGAVDGENYFLALLKVSDPHGPFGRVLAKNTYRDVAKFD